MRAAKRLFVSQPSLTKAIKRIGKGNGYYHFDRTNKGITVSKEGERFLGYARQVLEQAALLEEQYKAKAVVKAIFCFYTTLLLCSKCLFRAFKRCRH